MGYNLSSGFKKSPCRICGIGVDCRHFTKTARCDDCKYKQDQEKSKQDKLDAKNMIWGY